MWKDPIVEEIHKVREMHAKRFNYDLDAIFNDLKRRQAKRNNLTRIKPVNPVTVCVAERRKTYRIGKCGKRP